MATPRMRPWLEMCDFRRKTKTNFRPVTLRFRMSHASDIFPSCVRDKLFKTAVGDVCLCLHESWPSLLNDLGLLGPTILISRNEQLALAAPSYQLDFAPVPGRTEMIDLNSGLCLETGALGAVVTGQEARTGNLGFHFFDWEGKGMLKVLLTPETDRDGFAQLARRYAKVCLPRGSQGFRSQTALREDPAADEASAGLQEAWASFDPALEGNFLPGGGGVGWLDALRLAGRDRAAFLTKAGLIKAIRAAHQDLIPLRITTCRNGLRHQMDCVPRRLEQCGRCLHLFEGESELHLSPTSDMEIWVGFHGQERVRAIHLFSDSGERHGVIQFAGMDDEREAWNRAITVAAGIRRDY
jgi:putative heme degradation protein